MRSLCLTCQIPTNHTVLHESPVNIHEEESGWWEVHTYQIIKCDGCDTLSFRKLYNDAEQDQYAAGTEEDPVTQELYPERRINDIVVKQFTKIPITIKKIYSETIIALNSDNIILAGVGIRAIIESICNDKNIIGGFVTKKGRKDFKVTLEGKIEGLQQKGFIQRGNINTLHELRFIGNSSVHKLFEHEKTDLKTAIEIIEGILDYLYGITEKGKLLKTKRENRES